MIISIIIITSHFILIHQALGEERVGTILMSIQDLLLKKSKRFKYNNYTQTIGTLNAYEPIIFAGSQEPGMRLYCFKLWRHCCVLNM